MLSTRSRRPLAPRGRVGDLVAVPGTVPPGGKLTGSLLSPFLSNSEVKPEP